MKIDQFKAQYDTMARPNRFNVAIFGVGNKVKGLKLRGIRCESASHPGRGFMTATPADHGPRRTVPLAPQYDPFDCVFRLDNRMEDRRIIDLWQEQIFTPAPEFMNRYHDDYQGTIYLEQLDHYGQCIMRTVMVEAFPMQISSMAFSQDDSSIQKVSCQFMYRNFYSEYPNAGSSSLIGGFLSKVGKKLGRKVQEKLNNELFG